MINLTPAQAQATLTALYLARDTYTQHAIELRTLGNAILANTFTAQAVEAQKLIEHIQDHQ